MQGKFNIRQSTNIHIKRVNENNHDYLHLCRKGIWQNGALIHIKYTQVETDGN